MIWGEADVIIIEVKHSTNVIHWIIPKSSPNLVLPSVEKQASTKPVPDAKNIEDHCTVNSQWKLIITLLSFTPNFDSWAFSWKSDWMRNKV